MPLNQKLSSQKLASKSNRISENVFFTASETSPNLTDIDFTRNSFTFWGYVPHACIGKIFARAEVGHTCCPLPILLTTHVLPEDAQTVLWDSAQVCTFDLFSDCMESSRNEDTIRVLKSPSPDLIFDFLSHSRL